jgi:hypothetical protein
MCERGDPDVDRQDPRGSAQTSVREARLKAEFAHLYPALQAGQWESAALLADRVVAWLVRQPDRGYVAPERVLRSEHFEFRGGGSAQETSHSVARRHNPSDEK